MTPLTHTTPRLLRLARAGDQDARREVVRLSLRGGETCVGWGDVDRSALCSGVSVPYLGHVDGNSDGDGTSATYGRSDGDGDGNGYVDGDVGGGEGDGFGYVYGNGDGGGYGDGRGYGPGYGGGDYA